MAVILSKCHSLMKRQEIASVQSYMKRKFKVWLWLRKQYDKLEQSNGLLKKGKWYVRYPDGKRTSAMTYDAAKSYRERFGGKVWHLTDTELV